MIDLDAIRAAQRLIAPVVVRTPLEESRWLSGVVGGRVLLKAENLQRAGSFKIRGAYVRMSRLTPAERAAGVVAASAGNHAQGVALAAQLLDIPAVVYMPRGASIPKEAATRGYGAEVRIAGATIDEALTHAEAYAAETGATLVHPFDHPDIVAGQGTLGLELLEQCPEVASVVVPVGGGGLAAGVAHAIRTVRPDVRIVGVQAAAAAAYPASLRAGAPVALDRMATIADGIAVARPGNLPFAHVRAEVDEVVTVSEDQIAHAVLHLMERAKLTVEPAGAVAVAALLAAPAAFTTPVCAVLSGGNIDPLLMMNVIRHGLAASGRYLSVRVRIPDRTGGLAGLLAELVRCEVNVQEVAHDRATRHALGEVDVSLQLETRGREHTRAVVATLREHYLVLEHDAERP
ncbi:threonine ammonia-lyase [Nocardioides sp. L-11A]|uniref:threonine ammonia-lyase n=1 Tax=Nocardioides sp. L-11A TaxID=3043848 RepID=UPI00249AF04F|nr:threonine ammonia-lyase [Nocardioides sp. L-11A]